MTELEAFAVELAAAALIDQALTTLRPAAA
jgi:hypothetical protein